jgi:MarR family transcriptional regulator, temperature-dependent positive regulator of motility
VFEHCLYFNTAALARQLEKAWTQAFQPFGLAAPQAFLLRAVLAQPGLSPSELARLMVIAKPTVTRTLDGLLAKGLIERGPSGRDGRESVIHPTETARAIQAALNKASGSVTERMKRLLGVEGFTSAVSRVRDVRSALD